MIEVIYDTNPGMVRVNIPGREPLLIWDYAEVFNLVVDLSSALHLAWPGKDLSKRDPHVHASLRQSDD
jgi:hypothetical protein